MIKVAHVVTICRGALGVLEAKLAALDSYDDLDITIIAPPPPKGLDFPPSAVRQLYVPMVRPIKPLADLWCAWKLYRLLCHERFDVMHTHSAKAGVIGVLAARLARVPLVVHTYHGLPFFDSQNRIKYHEYRLFEIFACKFRHHIFSQNYRDIPECIKIMCSTDKVSYEGNGVNVKEVGARAQRDIEHAKNDFLPGKVRLALVSRLEPVKRVSDFLKACALLVSEGVEISAVIAGVGPLESALGQELDELGLRGQVRMLGWTPYVPSLFAVSDIAVLTSEKEGIPRSLIEAMALGKPVVATDVLGTQELVVNGETGFLTPLGKPETLADKIKLLSSDAELRRRFGEAGMIRVENHFNDIKIAAFLREFYLKKYHALNCGGLGQNL